MAPPSPEKKNGSASNAGPDRRSTSPAGKSVSPRRQQQVAKITMSSALISGTNTGASIEEEFSPLARVQDAIRAIKNNDIKLLLLFLHPAYELIENTPEPTTEQVQELLTERKDDLEAGLTGYDSYLGLDTRYSNSYKQAALKGPTNGNKRSEALASLIVNSCFGANTVDAENKSLLYRAVEAQAEAVVAILLRDKSADLYLGQDLGFWPYKLAVSLENQGIIKLFAEFYAKNINKNGTIVRKVDVKTSPLQYTPWDKMHKESKQALDSVLAILEESRSGIFTWIASWIQTDHYKKFQGELLYINDKLIPTLQQTRDVSGFIQAIVVASQQREASDYLKALNPKLIAIQTTLERTLQIVHTNAERAIMPANKQTAELMQRLDESDKRAQQLQQKLEQDSQRQREEEGRQEKLEIETAVNNARLDALENGVTGAALQAAKDKAREKTIKAIQDRKAKAPAPAPAPASSPPTGSRVHHAYADPGKVPVTPPRTGVEQQQTGLTPAANELTIGNGGQQNSPDSPSKRRRTSGNGFTIPSSSAS